MGSFPQIGMKIKKKLFQTTTQKMFETNIWKSAINKNTVKPRGLGELFSKFTKSTGYTQHSRLPMWKKLGQVTKHQEKDIHEVGTLPKRNMEPENGPLEKEIPIGNYHFQVPC